MKIDCLFVGKTSESYSEEGMRVYLKRLVHYLPVSVVIIPSSPVKESGIQKESDAILKKVYEKDFVFVLDE
jgi:23S rRNA (pseudouridine1915-N3)-methyltransferase